MDAIKGPDNLLAQCSGGDGPLDSLPVIAARAAVPGDNRVRIPSWDSRPFELDRCDQGRVCVDELRGICVEANVVIEELSTHLQESLIVANLAHDAACDGFARPGLRGDPAGWHAWAAAHVIMAASAVRRLGLSVMAKHPLARVQDDLSDSKARAMDHLAFIDLIHHRILALPVKDAQSRPDRRQCVCSGASSRIERAGRFRSSGDAQVVSPAVFTRLTRYCFRGSAAMTQESFLKSSAKGAAEGAAFLASHLIKATEKALDDFEHGQVDQTRLKPVQEFSRCA